MTQSVFQIINTKIYKKKFRSKTKKPIIDCNSLYKFKYNGTARRMLTHKGNLDKIISDIGEIQKNGFLTVNSQEFILKNYADYYVDDKSVLLSIF